MKIQIELELNEAMILLAVFSQDSHSKNTETIYRGQAVLDKIADQLDNIIAGLEAQAELENRGG